MTWQGNTHKMFTTVANELIKQGADDSTKTDVLAALMDHIGVPAMLAEKYREDTAIRALFASRGVTLLDRAPGAVHWPYEVCDCPNPRPGRPWHCAAGADA